MKKILLSFLLLVGIGLTAAAQLSDQLTNTDFTGMTYTTMKYYTSENGAKYAAQANSNKGFQMRTSKKGTGVKVVTPPSGYIVESVQITFGSPIGGGVNIYASDNEIDLYNLPASADAQTTENATINVGKAFFAVTPTNDSYCVVSKIIVNYAKAPAIESNAVFENISVEAGMSADIVYTPEDLSEITYVSGDETIVKVEGGKVIGVSEGTATITASWPEGKYVAGETTFDVTVTKARTRSEISFDIEHVDGKIGTGIVWQTVNIIAGDGKVTYTSSNTDIVSVNAETGEITPADVHAAGQAIITATIAATENYNEASVSYEAHIIDPDTPIEEAGQIEFDFLNNAYGMTRDDTSAPNFDYEFSDENNIIKVKINGSGNVRFWNDGFRFYNSCKKNVTFSIPEEYVLTKISVIRSGNGDVYFSGDGYDKDSRSWSGEANEVTLLMNNTSGSQVKITGFVVHYKKLSSALKPSQLTFTPRINAAVVGKKTALNGANNPNGRELTYKIAGLADTDYSIEKTEAGINVTVNKTGSYTLRAESLEDGEYMAGLAIMRLNVYPEVAPKFSKDIVGNSIDLIDGNVKVSFDIPEGFSIHCNVTEDGAPETKTEYYEYTEGEEIEISAAGSFSYYLKNVQNYDSDVVTYEVVKSEPTKIVGITHEVLAGKTVVRANYTLHVNNHREGNTYEVTFTVGGQTGTNTEHTLVTEEEAAVAPVAEGFTSTHKLKGTVVVTGLTGETDYKGSSLAVKVNGEDTASHTTEFDVKTGTVGIEDVTVDAAASAEYFTLQGVRVAQPEAGNIYIVRRGAEVSKELVK